MDLVDEVATQIWTASRSTKAISQVKLGSQSLISAKTLA